MIQQLLLNTQMIWLKFIKNTGKYNANKKRKILIILTI